MIFDGHINWNEGVVAGSCLIAVIASIAAFWIIFRLLAVYPNFELLRAAGYF